MAANQPTIPVKKPDGSVVRMTMSEFAAYKKGQKDDAPVSAAPSSPFAPPAAPPAPPAPPKLTEKKDPSLDEKLANLKAREKEHFAKKHRIPRVPHPPRKTSVPVPPAPPSRQKNDDVVLPPPPPIPIPPPSPVVPSPPPPPIDFAAIEKAEEALAEDLARPAKKEKKKHAQKTLAKRTPTALSTTTPVVDIFKDEAKAKMHKWEKEDSASPLEEEHEKSEERAAHTPVSTSSAAGVELVFANIDLPFGDDVKKRLYPLFLSRIKDIRSSEQVQEKLLHAKDAGGFGFSHTEADQIMRALALALNTTTSEQKEQKPKVAPPKTTKVATKFSHGPADDHISAQHAVPENLGVRQSVGKKPIIHDIIVPKGAAALSDMLSGGSSSAVEPPAQKKRTVGPVGEFESMDLTTFRRIGDTTEAIVAKLHERLGLMKKDSYLLYMEGKKAWRRSPLYIQYTNLLTRALNEKRTLSQQLDMQDAEVPLTQVDIDAIIAFNHTL
ncbi:MAG: hypothetical protein HOL80_01405 [Candidatus Magasanikbacteria bacterium]|nr:hypothetical protein [Candidatus Magasanikbacteria bacterium]